MKKAHILHNPQAGKQEKSKKELIALFKAKGLEWGYSSTKKSGWKKIHSKTDFLVVAGGDGTVRKVAVKLIETKIIKRKIPLLLLPLGTANNIAKSLGIEGNTEEIMNELDSLNVKKFDVGRISGLKKGMLFLESFGYGIFPALMKEMNEKPEREEATPEENLNLALKVLHGIILNIPAKPFEINIDGRVLKESFLLVEVMNTPSIGPNLNLSPDADPGDGLLELILVPESQRDEFASYVSYKLGGVEKTFTPLIIKGKKIAIMAETADIHVDDELLNIKKAKKVKIATEPGMMEFFVQ